MAGASWLLASPMGLAAALSLADRFVASFTVRMQENIEDIMDLEHLVVEKMDKVSLPPALALALALPASSLVAPSLFLFFSLFASRSPVFRSSRPPCACACAGGFGGGCMLAAVMCILEGRQEKKLLVELFQTCGKVELAFVIRSGLYFGFLLGILQMAVWVCWDPWWSLAVGGALVGYVTNFIAIKSVRSLPLLIWPVVCAQQQGASWR